MMVTAGLAAIAAIAIGCGSEEEEPAPELGTTSGSTAGKGKIRGAIDRFNLAAEGRDAELLCTDVLPPSSVTDEPERCEAAIDNLMRNSPDNFLQFGTPRKIEIVGNSAKARAVQGESRETIRLVREDGRWYIEVFD